MTDFDNSNIVESWKSKTLSPALGALAHETPPRRLPPPRSRRRRRAVRRRHRRRARRAGGHALLPPEGAQERRGRGMPPRRPIADLRAELRDDERPARVPDSQLLRRASPVATARAPEPCSQGLSPVPRKRKEIPMRLQLALNVDDLEAAIEFYSEDVRRRGQQAEARLRELRDRRAAPEARALRASRRSRAAEPPRGGGLRGRGGRRRDRASPHRRHGSPGRRREDLLLRESNKVWAQEPGGIRWEWYRVLENSETFGESPPLEEEAKPVAPPPADASLVAARGRVSGPGKAGGRFSRAAARPSFTSSVSKQRAWTSASKLS